MEQTYRMVLVDDEDEVRGRINAKIAEERAFEVVGSAGNGYDALELIERHAPHIVLTDIKMPYIDGIELAKIIKRDYPTVKIAFISGYDEFEYAREAIDLHVSSYLTKPVSQEDITRFLVKLKEELDSELTEQYNNEILKTRYEQSIPMIIENFFSSVLITNGYYRKQDIERLHDYGLRLDDSRYLVAYVKLDQHEQAEGKDSEERKISVRTTIQTTLKRYGYVEYSFLYLDGIVFLIKEKGADFSHRIDQALFEMVKISEKFLSASISIGVSNLHREFIQLPAAYQEAETALGYSNFLQTGRIVYIDQLEGEKTERLRLSEQEINSLEYSAKYGDARAVHTSIEEMRKEAMGNKKLVTNFRIYSIRLVDVVLRFAESIGVELHHVVSGDILEILMGFRSLDSLFSWVEQTILKLQEYNRDTKQTSSQRYLESTVNYIQQHFADPNMSMESICDQQGISVSYLSLLFKKQMNTTFVRFLTKTRMEKAHELLKFTGDRVVEIAQACGYRDVYYFSHSFKRYYGISPRKYRETL